MSIKLSIVIPCYNCKKTLRESVDSVYKQNLPEGSFEIIMVDDGSTDGTKNLMENIQLEHPEVLLIFHEKNKGGGAARNTGIRSAKGELIYCLDSDNFFTEDNSLNKMVQQIQVENIDGVAFHERRFFMGNNKKDYSSKWNTVIDRPIELGDLFLKENILLDNFMFTKESYMKTAGFPENHGFDTQCFEIRYISAGNKVYICKDTVFYHRQMPSAGSYFEREYDNGNFSKNYYFIIEEILEKLTIEAQKAIILFDIFKRSSMKDNLLNELKNLHVAGKLFNKKDDKNQQGELSKPDIEEKPYLLYIEAIKAYMDRDFNKSLSITTQAIGLGLNSKLIFYHMLRCAVGISGIHPNFINKETDLLVTDGLHTEKKNLYKFHNRIPFVNKLINTLNIWKKIYLK